MNYKIEDNQVIDLETGEILGPAITTAGIESVEALHAVMEDIYNAEAIVASEETKKALAVEFYDRKVKRAKSYAEYKKSVYLPHLENYARNNPDKNKKSVATPLGSFGFRTKKGGLRVHVDDNALLIAQTEGWTNAIQVTEKFKISELTEAQKAVLIERYQAGNLAVKNAFMIEPDSETFQLKVGK